MDSLFCWPTTSGHGACLGVWLINPGTLHWRRLIFTFPRYHLEIDSKWGEKLFPLHISLLGICLVWVCAGFEFLIKIFMLHMWISLAVLGRHWKDTPDSFTSGLTVITPSVPSQSQILKERNVIKISHVGLSTPKFLSLFTLSINEGFKTKEKVREREEMESH